MRKTLICLLLVSLTPTHLQASMREALAVWSNSAQAAKEPLPAKPKRKKKRPRKKPTPTPTPTPTPAPANRELQQQKYPVPVVDEDNPAVSPMVSGLTGTFRLNTKDSDAQDVSAKAIEEMFSREQQRIPEGVQARLEAPYALAIELRGKTVNIISTRAQKISFEADGREHVEPLPDGNVRRVSAKLDDSKLVVMSSGSSGQGFKVVFAPAEGGRLYVIRELSDKRLKEPIVIKSVYDRVADVAHWESFNVKPPAVTHGEASASASALPEVIVPQGELLLATLNEKLTTKEAREGDRFTMTVREPWQLAGAIIEGSVTSIERGVRATGRSAMSLNLDMIRLSNGRPYRFAGVIETVSTAGEETVRVDNEGRVSDDHQRTTVVTRTAIGTSMGAIIGAIAGSGKGAVIGATIGAGTGAGSVYVQGKNDLELAAGSKLTIRATGPR